MKRIAWSEAGPVTQDAEQDAGLPPPTAFLALARAVAADVGVGAKAARAQAPPAVGTTMPLAQKGRTT